jgi:hypothetical protein
MASSSNSARANGGAGGSSSTREIGKETTFPEEAVKRLRESDFLLDTDDLIRTRWDDCLVVLFYSENSESFNLTKIWGLVAAQVAGPIFAACNCISEKRVAEAFTRLNMSEDHPHRWASLSQFPFILVYRQGWPQAFYNGERSVSAIADWALTLACKAGYTEKVQKAGSMQVESNVGMANAGAFVPRMSSERYTSSDPVRKYDPTIPITLLSSSGSREEAMRRMVAAASPSPYMAGGSPGPSPRYGVPVHVTPRGY